MNSDVSLPLKVVVAGIAIVTILGITLLTGVALVARDAHDTAERVDRNTPRIAATARQAKRQSVQLDVLRREFVRRGFFFNCSAVVAIAQAHEHGDPKVDKIAKTDCNALKTRLSRKLN